MAQLQAPTRTVVRKSKAMDTAATSESSPMASTPSAADLEQAVREAAYALFVARGCEPGHDLDDWLTAEARVRQAHAEPVSGQGTGQLAH